MKKTLIVLCVAALILGVFAGCSKKKDTTTTATTTTATTTAKSDDNSAIVGYWANDKETYVFNEDGEGQILENDTGTGIPIKFKLDTKECNIYMTWADAGNNKNASYEFKDNNTLVLSYEDGETVTLTRTDKLPENKAATNDDSDKIVGTWKNDNETYHFNEDGSGDILENDDGTGVPTTYEVDSATHVLHMTNGAASNKEDVNYEFTDDNTLVLNYIDGRTVTLTRAS